MFATDLEDMKPDKYIQRDASLKGPKLEIFAELFYTIQACMGR
jgi:hypothetical protein